MKLSELQDEGLNKLYTAMINILRWWMKKGGWSDG
jgi:hypothetical protein